MTENNKNKFAIIGLTIMFLCLVLYTSIVIAEFYVSKHGEVAIARVINVSELCKQKNKYLTISIESKTERIQVYGTTCRKDEFIPGSSIEVRRSRLLHIITLPNNLEGTRLVVFPLFTLVLLVGLVSTIRNKKRVLKNNEFLLSR